MLSACGLEYWRQCIGANTLFDTWTLEFAPRIARRTMAVSESEDEIVIEGEGIEGEGLSETLRGTRIQTHTLCTAKATVWKTSRQPSART